MILGSIVVSIPACHAGDRGSIPRRGAINYFISGILNHILKFAKNIILINTSVILGSILVSIPACHAGDRGSIPRRGAINYFISVILNPLFKFGKNNSNKHIRDPR